MTVNKLGLCRFCFEPIRPRQRVVVAMGELAHASCLEKLDSREGLPLEKRLYLGSGKWWKA